MAASGPYIVTTKRPIAQEGGCGEILVVASRRAVATLEEARVEVFDQLTATEDLAEHFGGGASRLADSIEPSEHVTLPDGTVIEVEQADGRPSSSLWVEPKWFKVYPPRTWQDNCDAYNAREASRGQ